MPLQNICVHIYTLSVESGHQYDVIDSISNCIATRYMYEGRWVLRAHKVQSLHVLVSCIKQAMDDGLSSGNIYKLARTTS